eukprot:UN09456
MLTIATMQKPAISMPLHDQLQDLTIKYEALENQQKTMKLENKEYKHHIVMLQHRNDDLQKELLHYKEHHNHHEQHIKPMLNLHINSIQDSLNHHDEEMEKLQETNQQYAKLLKTTKSENSTIKQENEKYRIALENCKKQALQNDILRQLHDDTITANKNEINSLENELQLLRDQLYAINTIKLANRTPVAFSPIATILPDKTPRIAFLKSSVEESPYHFVSLCNVSRKGTVDTYMEEYEYEERLEKI